MGRGRHLNSSRGKEGTAVFPATFSPVDGGHKRARCFSWVLARYCLRLSAWAKHLVSTGGSSQGFGDSNEKTNEVSRPGLRVELGLALYCPKFAGTVHHGGSRRMRQRVALYSPSGSRKVNAAAQLCFSYLFSSRLESPCYPPSGYSATSVRKAANVGSLLEKSSGLHKHLGTWVNGGHHFHRGSHDCELLKLVLLSSECRD
eukprot:XP_008765964.1 PREDICTED: uncharacterized protein LOC102548702 [Rattus norvegicus]